MLRAGAFRQAGGEVGEDAGADAVVDKREREGDHLLVLLHGGLPVRGDGLGDVEGLQPGADLQLTPEALVADVAGIVGGAQILVDGPDGRVAADSEFDAAASGVIPLLQQHPEEVEQHSFHAPTLRKYTGAP